MSAFSRYKRHTVFPLSPELIHGIHARDSSPLRISSLLFARVKWCIFLYLSFFFLLFLYFISFYFFFSLSFLSAPMYKLRQWRSSFVYFPSISLWATLFVLIGIPFTPAGSTCHQSFLIAPFRQIIFFSFFLLSFSLSLSPPSFLFPR